MVGEISLIHGDAIRNIRRDSTSQRQVWNQPSRVADKDRSCPLSTRSRKATGAYEVPNATFQGKQNTLGAFPADTFRSMNDVGLLSGLTRSQKRN
jgi:hypothetical protein